MNEIKLTFTLWERQKAALLSKATEILFGGASEGGKSHLVRVLLIVLCLAIPGLQCVLIRKKYADILSNHVEGPTGFRALLAPLIAAGAVRITKDEIRFPGDAVISFVHCQDERQFDSAQGVEKHVLVIDEATQISERLIRFFRAWVRMPKEFKDKLPAQWRDRLPLILYTANPFGPSAPFFRRNFVKARAPMAIEMVEGFLRQYIPSRAEDNPSIDLEQHKARLDGLHDPGLAKALDQGDWDAPVGEFFPQYDEVRHVMPNCILPEHWFKFLTFDWGGSDPGAVLWWGVSDGQPFRGPLGQDIWARRGALICYREWYIADPQDPGKGLQMRNEDMAAGIINRTLEKTSGLVLTDSLPFQDRGMSKNGKAYRIADVFSEAGCPLVPANTARVTGWAQLRDRLIGKDGDPLILFQENCRFCREYLPALTRSDTNPEDAAEDGEPTHICLAAGTLVATEHGAMPIEQVVGGTRVVCADGKVRPCLAAGLTKQKAQVVTLKFGNGETLTCTPDHRILTVSGWKSALDSIRYASIWNQKQYHQQSKSLMELNTIYTKAKSTIRHIDISKVKSACMWRYGSITMARCRRGIMFTTKTAIGAITRLKTFVLCRKAIMCQSTCGNLRTVSAAGETFSRRLRLQQSGTEAPRAWHGIKSIINQPHARFGRPKSLKVVQYAGLFLRRTITRLTALIAARRSIIEAWDNTPRKNPAPFVERDFSAISIEPAGLALVRALQHFDIVRTERIESAAPVDVYCLTEPVTHGFQLANGLIVKNCDCIRYACTARPLVKDEKQAVSSYVKPEIMTPTAILKQLQRQNGGRKYH